MNNGMTSVLVARANAQQALDVKKQVLAGMAKNLQFGTRPLIDRLQQLLNQESTARTACGFLSIFRRNRLPLLDASKALTVLRNAVNGEGDLAPALASCKKHFGSATYMQARSKRVDGGRSLVTVSIADAINVLEGKMKAPAVRAQKAI